VIAVLILLAAAGLFIYRRSLFHTSATQRALTRLTFDPGLQIGVTWSPDGRYIAYGSNRSGKFDNWLQQVSGGNPVQITKGPGNTFESPGPTVPRQIPDVELSLTQDKLVLTMEELSGSIWVLDNVGP
jgi:hypothetical protein